MLTTADARQSGIESPANVVSRDPAQPVFDRPRLLGRVVDSKGEPLAGVRVDFSSEDGFSAPSADSDAAGRFERQLESAPTQGAPLEALAQSAEFCESRVVIHADEPALIVMRRLPRVEVRVVGPDGAAPSGSGRVTLGVRGKQNTSLRETSLILDDDGVARSDPLQPGQLVRVCAFFDGFAMKDLARSDELVSDATVHIDVLLSRGVTMRGVVLDERTRRPVAGALVRAEPSDARNLLASPSATTGNSGSFELRGVTASQRIFESPEMLSDLYVLTVEVEDFAFPLERRTVLKHAAAMPPPALVDDLELQLMPAGCGLVVTLHWPDGRASGTQFQVRALDPEGNVFESQASTEGEFAFLELPAGELRVIATSIRPWIARGVACAEISLLRGEKKVLALTLRHADAAIEGRVLDAQGRGLPNVLLSARNFVVQSGARTLVDTLFDFTTSEGRFRIATIYPGVCELTAITDDEMAPLGFWPPLRTVELDEGSLLTSVDFRAEPAVVYAGTLSPMTAIDASEPVLLELTHAQFGTVASLSVHEDGRFTFPGVFGADYLLIAKQGLKELGRLAISRTSNRELVVPLAR